MARKKLLSYQRFRELTALALSTGAQARANGALLWDISGGCHAPPTFTLVCHNNDQTQHRYIDLVSRCRRCDPCLKARAALWRIRMENEIRLASRTWLMTLTLSPENQAKALMSAQHRLRKREVLWTEIDEGRRFTETHLSISPEITRFVKRVRKNSSADIRLCCVAERHKSGLPHYHALIHEVHPDQPVRHSKLVKAWEWGFSHAKLVADHGAGKTSAYVAKYLTKSSLARVRASRGYGRIALEQVPPEGLRRQVHTEPPTHPQSESVRPEPSMGEWLEFLATLRHDAQG